MKSRVVSVRKKIRGAMNRRHSLVLQAVCDATAPSAKGDIEQQWSFGGRGKRRAKLDFALARKDQNAGFGV